MRSIGLAGGVLLGAWIALAALFGRGGPPHDLPSFARNVGLREVDAFTETVRTLRQTRELPPRYVTKGQANSRGWHGGGLCTILPDHVVGGDELHNFGRVLADAPGRTFREADLDSDCRGRGPRRLVFTNDGQIYVTLDHYQTFVPVPAELQ